MLDSGADVSLIDSQLAHELRLKLQATQQVIQSATGDKFDTLGETMVNIGIPNANKHQQLRVIVVNELFVPLIFGIDALRSLKMRVEFDTHTITFADGGSVRPIRNRPSDLDAKPVLLCHAVSLLPHSITEVVVNVGDPDHGAIKREDTCFVPEASAHASATTAIDPNQPGVSIEAQTIALRNGIGRLAITNESDQHVMLKAATIITKAATACDSVVVSTTKEGEISACTEPIGTKPSNNDLEQAIRAKVDSNPEITQQQKQQLTDLLLR